jgi:hypothetical protein
MDPIKEEVDSDSEVLPLFTVVNIKTEPETILDEVSSDFDGLLSLRHAI